MAARRARREVHAPAGAGDPGDGRFAIIQTGPSSFEVTRRVTSTAPDDRPPDHVEPTAPQKEVAAGGAD